ncbi:Component of the BRCA1-A complex, partial [Modicella reniformis]
HADLEDDDGSTIRVIMFYTRSDVLPSLPDREILNALYSSGRFYYDCVYVHQKAAEVSGLLKPQHVYDRLTEIEDQRAPGYYFELTKVLKKFCTAMSELLAHPRVRPIQDEASWKMKPPPSVRRMEEKVLQQEQHHLQQQTYSAASPKRSEIPIAYRNSDMGNINISNSKSTDIFGNPKRTSTSTSLVPMRTGSPSFMSSTERERERANSSRIKIEAQQYTGSGSPGGSMESHRNNRGGSTGSGSGTGLDDAILI